MNEFVKLTTGNGNDSVIMGKNTWLSMKRNSNPFPILPGRLLIVVTSEPELLNKSNENVLFVNSIEKAIYEAEKRIKDTKNDKIWIAGGLQLYQSFIDLQVPIKMKIHYQPKFIREDCNVFFPEKAGKFTLEQFFHDTRFLLGDDWYDREI